VDPWADPEDAMKEYGIKLSDNSVLKDVDCLIVAVAHNEFKALSLDEIKSFFRTDIPDNEKVLIDVKGLYSVKDLKASGLKFWRL
ncbi:MAG: nucleotide sugar dehydrogenase, partial [Clostridia bacterium]|nr:nucleotide sugar dehydrogenase [Clostridia bacterium]